MKQLDAAPGVLLYGDRNSVVNVWSNGYGNWFVQVTPESPVPDLPQQIVRLRAKARKALGMELDARFGTDGGDLGTFITSDIQLNVYGRILSVTFAERTGL